MIEPPLHTLPELGLLDVLEQLPRNVLRESLWLHLKEPPTEDDLPGFRRGLPRSPGCAFRATCARSLRLSDQLTRWAKLFCTSGLPVADMAESIRAHSTFLARQEGLEELTLQEHSARVNNNNDVVPRTLHQSGAACRRLQRLVLDLSSDCNAATGEAIQACCPQLTELSMSFSHVGAAFFVQLRNCRRLATLVMGATCQSYEWRSKTVRELSDLPSLRSIQLTGRMKGANFHHLAALTAVQQLRLCGLVVRAAAEDATRLGGLLGGMTQLTALEAPMWDTPRFEKAEFINSVAAQLGSLRCLTSLLISKMATIEEVQFLIGDGFAALCQLTALTQLTCAGIELQVDPSAGRLQQLQHLELSGNLSPHSLAASLRPFGPLPALQWLVATVCLDMLSDIGDDIVDEPEAGRRAVAAVREGAGLLAAAPGLQGICLLLHCDISDGSDRAHTLLCSSLAEAMLGPLLGRLRSLHLCRLPEGAMEVVWPLLRQATRLNTLQVSECSLSETQLLWVGQDMHALTHLRVFGFTGALFGFGRALAATCALPRCAGWSPWRAAERSGEVRAWRARE